MGSCSIDSFDLLDTVCWLGFHALSPRPELTILILFQLLPVQSEHCINAREGINTPFVSPRNVLGYADSATDTIDFAIAPHLAVEKLLTFTGVRKHNIDLWEINEAFSVVVLANIRLLDLPIEKVNIHGGAVSCGHPIG